jgi:hypothetical protein
MANLPFRDINVHASTSHYAFTSPSNPSAPTLVIERPSGDLRLNDGSLLGAKRVSSIAGILGIIKLKLGQSASKCLPENQRDDFAPRIKLQFSSLPYLGESLDP